MTNYDWHDIIISELREREDLEMIDYSTTFEILRGQPKMEFVYGISKYREDTEILKKEPHIANTFNWLKKTLLLIVPSHYSCHFVIYVHRLLRYKGDIGVEKKPFLMITFSYSNWHDKYNQPIFELDLLEKLLKGAVDGFLLSTKEKDVTNMIILKEYIETLENSYLYFKREYFSEIFIKRLTNF